MSNLKPINKMKRIVKDLVEKSRYLYTSRLSIQQKFDYFYKHNIFEGRESISGEGSSLEQTKILLKKLDNLFKQLKIRSIVDAPCGDLNWIKHLNMKQISYLGVDVVKELIERNKEEFSSKTKKFVCADLTNYIPPKTDLILCRDCLVHLSNIDVIKVIKNFQKSGSKYLLTTTFPSRLANLDLNKTIWRTLNLQKSPFLLPKPFKLINEGCTENGNEYRDKSLGLWKLSDIKMP